MDSPKVKRALLSVSDKMGIADFAKGLASAGVELFSTGGTKRHLEENGIPVKDITDYTGFPEMMDGRLKTLHPKVHGGILCRRDNPDDMNSAKEHGIEPFELIIVNLYPFEMTVAKEGVTDEEAAIIESCVCPAGSMLAHPVQPGETVLVQGAGPAGLAYIQLAKIQGAKKVILSARKSYRTDIAMTVGADVHIDPTKEDVLARVLEETDGYGVDVSIDAAGFSATVDLAVKAACGGGRVILYGIPADTDKTDFPVTDIIIKQLSVFGACSSPDAWEPMLKWSDEGKFNLGALVSASYRIEDINQAIDDIENRRNNIVKAVISFK